MPPIPHIDPISIDMSRVIADQEAAFIPPHQSPADSTWNS